MSGFPGLPKLAKGALVTMDGDGQTSQLVIAFQYNPETLTRTLVGNAIGEGQGSGDASDQLRLTGPPRETLSLEAELDATEQLESAGPGSEMIGLHPALATLELLLYPSSEAMQRNDALLSSGQLEVIPPPAPLLIFVWGDKRVLPVRLTDFSITEEAFDPALNPTRAKVRLGLRVLTYQDLGMKSSGGAMFLRHHIGKEALAARYKGSLAKAVTRLPGGPGQGGS